MMVGGIDKQIYLPYQLAQSLGFYKKYGVNMVLSTEQSGGVGAETAMVSGQVDMAGAWYVHTIDFQPRARTSRTWCSCPGRPASGDVRQGSGITSPPQWKGKIVGVTDIGSGTDQLTVYLAARYGLKQGTINRDRGRRRPDHDRRAAAPQDPCGMTTQPTVARDREAGRRHLGDRPHHHRRGAAVARRLLPDRRRAGPHQLGRPPTRPPCRRSSTRWSRPCTGSPRTARPTSPTRCRPSS